MAIFGKTDIGSTDRRDIGDTIRGTAYTCTEAGTADSITVYLDDWVSPEKITCAMYRKSDSVLVATTEERTTGGADGWYTFNFNAPKPVLTAQDYGLVAWSENLGSNTYVWYDGVSVYRYFKITDPADYPTYPDPFDGTEGTGSFQYSIYCTYTPATVRYTLINEMGY